MELQPFINQAEIAEIVHRLARQIDHDYHGQSIVAIAILKGSVFFFADLLRALQTPIERLEFIQLSSYRGETTSSGQVAMHSYLVPDVIRGKAVLVVEDIVDTGHSWATLKPQLLALQPQSLKICTLLDKPARRQTPVTLDYVGCIIDDEFVVGYGFDWQERYRQLPDLYRGIAPT